MASTSRPRQFSRPVTASAFLQADKIQEIIKTAAGIYPLSLTETIYVDRLGMYMEVKTLPIYFDRQAHTHTH